MKVARTRARWIWSALTYTLGGALTSTVLGACLGGLGAALIWPSAKPAALVCAFCVGLAILARDLGLTRYPLPQFPRQTFGWWGNHVPSPLAPAIWGLDVGLTFVTWQVFRGPLLIGAIALASGTPQLGAALFLALWAGRAASVWIAPLWAPSAASTSDLLQEIEAHRARLRSAHAGAVTIATVLMALSAI